MLLRSDIGLGESPSHLGALVRDPVLWAGLCFLLLLGLQWWNAGRPLVFDGQEASWHYASPRLPWLPSAIDPKDAAQMWQWFFPAAVAVTLLRHGVKRAESILALFTFLAVHAGILALFGMVQMARGAPLLFESEPTGAHFFATFGYRNHAGAFFVLMLCLSMGLGLHGLDGEAQKPSRARTVAAVVALILCLTACHLSYSRAAMGMAWVVCGIGVWTVGRRLIPRLAPAARFEAALGLVACLLVTVFLVAGFGGRSLQKEMRALRPERAVQSLASGRWFQTAAAARIWADHPWFGVGGWGYRYLVALYLGPEKWDQLTHGGEDATITANVHNDVMQFLAEFGAVGFGLMALVVLMLARRLKNLPRGDQPLVFFPALGLALVFLYSFLDLPFRCPAVLYAWLVLLTASGKLVKRPGTSYPAKA